MSDAQLFFLCQQLTPHNSTSSLGSFTPFEGTFGPLKALLNSLKKRPLYRLLVDGANEDRMSSSRSSRSSWQRCSMSGSWSARDTADVTESVFKLNVGIDSLGFASRGLAKQLPINQLSVFWKQINYYQNDYGYFKLD